VDANNQGGGDPSFGEGLTRVLSGLNVATTRNVISATMTHLIPCNGGSRFVFLHEFLNLLVGQMEATLEGQDINVRIQTNKVCNKIITWPDSIANDYRENRQSLHVFNLWPVKYHTKKIAVQIPLQVCLLSKSTRHF
jgi:hypothetical protein